ncbi:MAG TPA: hypothetical protein VF472_09450 [Burkholderiaceae bacterium]
MLLDALDEPHDAQGSSARACIAKAANPAHTAIKPHLIVFDAGTLMRILMISSLRHNGASMRPGKVAGNRAG